MNNVFQLYFEEENENLIKLHQGIFTGNYYFGLFCEKFMSKDVNFINVIIPKIESKLNSKDFQSNLVNLKTKEYEEEKNSLVERIKSSFQSGMLNPIDLAKYNLVKKQLNEISFDRIVEDFKANFDCVWKEMAMVQSDLSFFKNNHTLYCIADILYKDFKSNVRTRFFTAKENRLSDLYKSKGIDLSKVDDQYNTYRLLTIDKNFQMKIGNTPKVYDKRLGTHLLITEISPELFGVFDELLNKRVISNLSLRPDYNVVGESILNLSILLEEIELGKVFSFSDLGVVNISKLYSSDYSDVLWVVIDDRNITFEEIVDDCIIYEDSIVTQVLHLEYKIDGEKKHINHIDHEYIFYTLDQFEKRQNNHKIKGEALTRFKTFKIDNSKIPFYLEDKSFFIYRVLDCYFKNKKLLKEYFSSVPL
ncbi:hypothetical protein [Vibrio splendidus]|uniref:hypothetical protein n=1 Tax=Vibrio splendidus TaxID=29497 RepID=UPI00148B9343|nr:hypothetical protein [Vibrio splendidus]